MIESQFSTVMLDVLNDVITEREKLVEILNFRPSMLNVLNDVVAERERLVSDDDVV